MPGKETLSIYLASHKWKWGENEIPLLDFMYTKV